MTVVPFNGNNYNVPSTTEENWSGTYGVDGLLVALATKSVNPQGGLFSLQNDLDFGPTAGTAAVYYKSRASDIAQAGVFRFGHADTINWRNAANTADLPFGVDTLNRATFNGTLLLASAGVVAASRALASDGSGNVVSSAVTATELGYVSGVTSAIQTQLNTVTGNVSTNTTNIASNTSSISTNLTTLTNHTGASTGVHGVAGSVVGTSDAQTLSNKSILFPTVSKTSAYTALLTDDAILCDATSAAFTITLPTAVGNTGKRFTVKKTDSSANAITVGTTSSQTIDTQTSTNLVAQYEQIQVQSDGSNWQILNRVYPRTALSSSCGNYNNNWTTSAPIQVTNLSVTITTTGRPVWVGLIPDGVSAASFGVSNNTGAVASLIGSFQVRRGGTKIADTNIQANAVNAGGAILVPPGSLFHVDTPAAGTYTYSIYVDNANPPVATTIYVRQSKLLAYELS